MTAKWGHSWRKLYRHPSSAWLALPLSVRGLGDELIRYAEDDGRIFVGADDPIGALARRMGAHPSERKWMAKSIETLERDGFCKVEEGHLHIRNFVPAQESVTDSAVRMRKSRAATNPGPTDDRPQTDRTPTSQPHGHQPQTSDGRAKATARNDTSASVTVTSPKEEKREEEKRARPPTPVTPQAGGQDEVGRFEHDVGALVARWVAESNGRLAPGVAPRQLEMLAELVAAARVQGFTAAEVGAIGRWLDPAGGKGLGWMTKRRPDVAWLLDGCGEHFFEALNDCRGWLAEAASPRAPADVVPLATRFPVPAAVARQRAFAANAVRGPDAAARVREMREAAMRGNRAG